MTELGKRQAPGSACATGENQSDSERRSDASKTHRCRDESRSDRYGNSEDGSDGRSADDVPAMAVDEARNGGESSEPGSSSGSEREDRRNNKRRKDKSRSSDRKRREHRSESDENSSGSDTEVDERRPAPSANSRSVRDERKYMTSEGVTMFKGASKDFESWAYRYERILDPVSQPHLGETPIEEKIHFSMEFFDKEEEGSQHILGSATFCVKIVLFAAESRKIEEMQRK